jgi:hypothetical protein
LVGDHAEIHKPAGSEKRGVRNGTARCTGRCEVPPHQRSGGGDDDGGGAESDDSARNTESMVGSLSSLDLSVRAADSG